MICFTSYNETGRIRSGHEMDLRDSYVDMAREMGDLFLLQDQAETPESTEAEPETVTIFALGTEHEPSVGIFGGPVTPYFESLEELDAYCANVILGVITTGELAERLK